MVNKYINATYQEIYDIATSPNKVTVIGIHTPSGSVPSKMLNGLWSQFKSVKYNGCDIVLRPTARQPLDPLQIGSTSGSQMDMRDAQNPILFRGCHGESLGVILNDLMGRSEGTHVFEGDSLEIDTGALSDLENFYYQCLTDMSWKKSMPENGFAFNGLHPLVYGLAANFQMVGTDADKSFVYGNNAYQNKPGTVEQITDINGTTRLNIANEGFQFDQNGSVISGLQRIFTNDLQPLGWMDTESRVGNDPSSDLTPNARIPKAYMGILMMPPSYSQGVKLYFRCVLTHYFTFKDFRSISLDSDYSSTPGYYDTLNVSKDADITLTSAAVR